MIAGPMIALTAAPHLLDAVRDSLLHHENATVYDPIDRVPSFSIRVERRVLVVVDADGVALGEFGSVRSAVRCGGARRPRRVCKV